MIVLTPAAMVAVGLGCYSRAADLMVFNGIAGVVGYARSRGTWVDVVAIVGCK
jgi:hypothetical protein